MAQRPPACRGSFFVAPAGGSSKDRRPPTLSTKAVWKRMHSANDPFGSEADSSTSARRSGSAGTAIRGYQRPQGRLQIKRQGQCGVRLRNELISYPPAARLRRQLSRPAARRFRRFRRKPDKSTLCPPRFLSGIEAEPGISHGARIPRLLCGIRVPNFPASSEENLGVNFPSSLSQVAHWMRKRLSMNRLTHRLVHVA